MATERQKGRNLLEKVSDYTVIDFETTGKYVTQCEIIEMSAVRVRNDEIVDTYSTLVKPTINIPTASTDVNGITDEMVENAPNLSEVLPDFVKFIGDDILIGYNIASYDSNILYDNALKLLDVVIKNDFIDTLRIAKYYCNINSSEYSLDSVCETLEVVNKTAHRALSDCIATHECYKIMKGMDWDKSFRHSPAPKEHTDYTLTEAFDVSGKSICLTGDFDFGSREEVKAYLSEMGAIIKSAVSGQTDYLIIGNLGSKDWKFGDHGDKTNSALEFQKKGAKVQIVNESDFFHQNNSEPEYIIDVDYSAETLPFDLGNSETLEKQLSEIIRIICERQAVDKKYIQLKETQGGGISVYIFDTYRVFNVLEKNTAKTQRYEVSILYKRRKYVKIPDSADFSNCDVPIYFPLDDTRNMLIYLLKFFEYELKHFQPSEHFGCCSRFEACSDERKCLHPDNFYARACSYRHNLEAGKIFYGKNRNV